MSVAPCDTLAPDDCPVRSRRGTAQLALQQTKALRAAASGRTLFDALAAELSVRHTKQFEN